MMESNHRHRIASTLLLFLTCITRCNSFLTRSSTNNHHSHQINPFHQLSMKQNDDNTNNKNPITTLLSSLTLATTLLTTLHPLPATATSTLPSTDTTQGLPLITQSTLGKSFRASIISSAKIADTLDLKWERLSDSLREQNKCDPRTNRRLFDNGVRKDGTPIGNPVLGALCVPEVLRGLDGVVGGVVMGGGEDAAVEVLGVERGVLVEGEGRVNSLVGAAFGKSGGTVEGEEALRQGYNKNLYIRMRSYSDIVSQQKEVEGNTKKQIARKLERTWGNKLLTQMAPNANRKDFTSPFPKPDPTDDQPYNEGALLDALGSVSVALTKMQEGGLIGHWEISIPEDDDWNVVTIAVDDDITIPGQILSRERGQPLSGSAVVAIVRSAMDEKAKISYAFDSFFIDPTTTKQELYNPTQLLISLSQLGQ